jgi:hypothetical protein
VRTALSALRQAGYGQQDVSESRLSLIVLATWAIKVHCITNGVQRKQYAPSGGRPLMRHGYELGVPQGLHHFSVVTPRQ